MVLRSSALSAGQEFMVWVFSQGLAPANHLQAFVNDLGLKWRDLDKGRAGPGGGVQLVDLIRESSPAESPEVFAWFEVGRNTILLSNLAGTGGSANLVDEAIRGYRGCLEGAVVPIESRDKLEDLIRSLSSSEMEEKTATLGKVLELLRSVASQQDREYGDTGYTEPPPPPPPPPHWGWAIFLVFVFVIVIGFLFFASTELTWGKMVILTVGGATLLTLLGAFMLVVTGVIPVAAFLELIRMAFQNLSVIKRKNSSETPEK